MDLGGRPPDAAPPSRGRLAVALGVGLVVAAGLLFLLAGRGRKPPRLPTDRTHQTAQAARRAEPCLACHARDADVPVPPHHTGREDCDSCHFPR